MARVCGHKFVLTASCAICAAEVAAKRLSKEVVAARARYADGTPEKYPGAKVSVRILDLEALLAVLPTEEQ